jgi:hypothetical protein
MKSKVIDKIYPTLNLIKSSGRTNQVLVVQGYDILNDCLLVTKLGDEETLYSMNLYKSLKILLKREGFFYDEWSLKSLRGKHLVCEMPGTMRFHWKIKECY